MAITPGALSQVAVTATQAQLKSAVATGGTTPYSYQWYRSTATGFTPGTANILSGKTGLTLTDSTLTPGTQYYYKVVATDSAATPQVATATQLALAALLSNPSPNQFAETMQVGMTDLRLNYNTIAVQFDPAGSGELRSGAAVKWSIVEGGIPMVVPCTGEDDDICGFVNFNFKDVKYIPGDTLEMSMKGNVMYLMATEPINRGLNLTSLPAAVPGGTTGGVRVAPAASGYPICGIALDTAAQSGKLIRVLIEAPSLVSA